MGRPSKGIRPWFDEKGSKTWFIRDPDGNKKINLYFGNDQPNAESRAWAECHKYQARKEAGTELLTTRQSASDVRIAQIVMFYLDKRITSWVPSREYSKPIARPEEVNQRLRIVVSFFQGATLDRLNRNQCEAFGMFVHNREIDRLRELYDRQHEIYVAKLERYNEKMRKREKLLADLASKRRNFVPPPLRTKPPVEPPPFDPKSIAFRPSAARRYLQDLGAALTMAVKWDIIAHRPYVHLPPPYDRRNAHFTRFEIRQLIRKAWFHKGMGWVNGKPVKDLYTRRHLARFIFLAITTGSRKDKIERVSFEDEGDRPWIDLWQEWQPDVDEKTGVDHGELVWKGRYHRLGDDEIEYENKQAPDLPILGSVARKLAQWREEGIKYPCAYPYHRSGKEEPGLVKDGMRTLFQEVFGEDSEVVIHTFRHTAATWLCAQGDLPLPSIAAYLGMTTETLYKTYAKHREADLVKVAEAIIDPSRKRSESGRQKRNRPRTKPAKAA